MSHQVSGVRRTHTILHLGLGSFHRAHQAVYLQHLHDSGDAEWGIVGANIRNDGEALMHDLAAVGGAYTLETVSPDNVHRYQKITSIQEILPWSPDLDEALRVGADDATKIISFTVTEGGYYLDDHDKLDLEQGAMRIDVESGAMMTIYGVIAAILRHRKSAVTLMSCDNLRSNGERFRSGFYDYLLIRGERDLLKWVETHVAFPSCMVDRITPRPTEAVQERVKAATGENDKCAVMGEEFIQWVIEDKFAAERPRWEDVGAELVTSVHPYEEAKIRILNSCHSLFAWAGTVKGFNYIHEAFQDPRIIEIARRYVREDVVACLHPSPIDLEKYLETTLYRFSNAALLDTNQRVAADSFPKIPGFILPTVKERLLSDAGSCAAAAALIAVFYIFLERLYADAIPYDYQDNGYDPARLRHIMCAPDRIHAFCSDKYFWGDMAEHDTLIREVRAAHDSVSSWLAPNADVIMPVR